MNLWNIVGSQNRLKGKWKSPAFEDVVKAYGKISRKIKDDLANLTDNEKAHIRFEDLEKEPVTELKKIYAHFKWDFTPGFEKKLNDHLKSLKNYKKNKFELTNDEKEVIDRVLLNS